MMREKEKEKVEASSRVLWNDKRRAGSSLTTSHSITPLIIPTVDNPARYSPLVRIPNDRTRQTLALRARTLTRELRSSLLVRA